MMCARARECPCPVISPSHRTILRENPPQVPESTPRSTGCAPRLSCRGSASSTNGVNDDVAPRAAVGGGSRRTEASSASARRLDLPGPEASRALGLRPVLVDKPLSLCGSSRAVGAARRRLQEGLRACRFRGRGMPGARLRVSLPAVTCIRARLALPWTAIAVRGKAAVPSR